jgi:hypothetical protein
LDIFKIAEWFHIFGQLYSTVKFTDKKSGQRMGWATFWAIFSQTHPVTLSHPLEKQEQTFFSAEQTNKLELL